MKFKTLGYISVIVLAIIASYYNLPKAFFVQDDYAGLGRASVISSTGDYSLLIPHSIFGRSLALAAFFIKFELFKFNPSGYYLISILFHVFNSLLLFYLVLLLSKNQNIAFISSMLFALNVPHAQAITWIAAFADLLASFFFLSCAIFFVKYLNCKKLYPYVLSVIFLFLALLSKESVMPLILLLPFLEFIRTAKKQINWLQMLVHFMPFLFLLLLFVSTNSLLTARIDYTAQSSAVHLSLNERLIKICFTSFKSIPQSFIPAALILLLLKPFLVFPYNAAPHQTEPVLFHFAEIFSIALSLVFLIASALSAYYLNKIGEREKSAILLFALLWVFLSSSIYGMLDWGVSKFMESRFYYTPAIGVVIAIALIGYSIYFWIGNAVKSCIIIKATRAVLFASLIFFLLSSAVSLQFAVNDLNTLSEAKTKILQPIFSQYPSLPPKSTILFENSYPLPFKANFGYVLAVLYEKGKSADNSLLLDKLKYWDLNQTNQFWQSSDKIENFGYFTDRRILQEFIANGTIELSQVHSFFYNGTHIVKTTEKTQAEILLNLSYYSKNVSRNHLEEFVVNDNGTVEQHIFDSVESELVNVNEWWPVGCSGLEYIRVGTRFNTTYLFNENNIDKVVLSVYANVNNAGFTGNLYARVSPNMRIWSNKILLATPQSVNGWHNTTLPLNFMNFEDKYTFISFETDADNCADLNSLSAYQIPVNKLPPSFNNSFACNQYNSTCNPFKSIPAKDTNLLIQLNVECQRNWSEPLFVDSQLSFTRI
ncbi:MAG: hypothetical protein HZC16_02720 [Candidatus Omnitrophica bacterium]|nr:hypothetical protein [Candidatus Omnitrophota bacterium]